MSYDEQRKLGLIKFNEYFFKCCKLSERRLLSNNGDRKLESSFATLKRKQESFAKILREENEIVSQYLIGNLSYFNRDLFDRSDVIKSMYRFENNLQILFLLNEKFEFEVDEYFVKKTISLEIFEEYESKFSSIKAVEFIESIMSKQFYKKRKFALGLFYCLKMELNLMKLSADDFKDLLNYYFGCNIKNLRLGHHSNSHSNHVKEFIKKWESFSN